MHLQMSLFIGPTEILCSIVEIFRPQVDPLTLHHYFNSEFIACVITFILTHIHHAYIHTVHIVATGLNGCCYGSREQLYVAVVSMFLAQPVNTVFLTAGCNAASPQCQLDAYIQTYT